ncbi:MAG: hypothetical protein JEZ12_16120 [Desulfobacterium sp.]|nr:hypothetical protein [Desulfobacterium sp.]
MTKDQIKYSLKHMRNGDLDTYEGERKKVDIHKSDEGILSIGGVEYTLDAAANIIDAIDPHSVYPSYEGEF